MERAKIPFFPIVLLGSLVAAGCDSVLEYAKEKDADLQEFFNTNEEDTPQVSSEQKSGDTPSKSSDTPPDDATNAYVKAEVLAEQDKEDETIKALRVAAAGGHATAAYELGQAYTLGVGVEKDLRAAERWFTRAAELGEPRALFLVGANHASGNGVPQDLEAAAYFYGEAAVRGHREAQYQLAEAFAKGNGVPKDLSWAMRWYGKAAYQAHADAQFSYGVLMAAGKGLPTNPEMAYRWVRLAELGGRTDAPPVLAGIEMSLSDEQQEAGENWVASFHPMQPADANNDRPTVAFVQYRLMKLGFQPGPVDGLLGSKSRSEINRYQESRNLPKNEIITDDLLEKLLAEKASPI